MEFLPVLQLTNRLGVPWQFAYRSAQLLFDCVLESRHEELLDRFFARVIKLEKVSDVLEDECKNELRVA